MSKLALLFALLCTVAVAARAAAAVPAPTGGLTATALPATAIQLTWADQSDNETGFAVWRTTGGGLYTRVGLTGANATSYQDNGLAPNTTYTYRVRAYNNEGVAAWSAPASATTPNTPAPPTALVALTSGDRRPTLTWTDNSASETGFAIWRQQGGGSWTRAGLVPTGVTIFQDAGVPALTKAVPLAVDRQAFTFGLEASLALSPCAKQHFWRLVVLNTTNADFEAMLRDGIPIPPLVGDVVGLDPDTGAVAAQIQSAVNSLIAQSQADPAYAQDSVLRHSSTNPRIIQVPLVEVVTTDDYTRPLQSKIIGFASLWLTGVSRHELKGYFVSQDTSSGTRYRYWVRAFNDQGVSPWSEAAIWPPLWVTSLPEVAP
jgi:hypothetical protein